MNLPASDVQDSSDRTSPVGTQRTRAAGAAAYGLAAFIVSAVILVVLGSPWLEVPWAIALVIFGPSARRMDRRLTVNLSLAFGLVPVFLWIPPVLGPRTSAVALISLATAAAVTAARSRRVVPNVRPRDSAIPFAGLLAGLVALPLGLPATPQQALAMLSTGIDNAFHYAMFLELRLVTASSPLVAAHADGTGFAFQDYPQWFHKLITVLAQIVFGDPEGAQVELVRFARLEWLVFVLVCVLMTAAFLQASPDRVPLPVLASALAVIFSLVLGVPGALNLIQGHLSFLVAACAPLVMFMLLARATKPPGLGLLVVLGGLALVTASWILLLPMAAAALLPGLVTAWRRQGARLRWTTLGVFMVLTAAIVAIFVLGPLTSGALQALLRDGTVPQVGIPTMVVVLLGAPVLVAGFALRRNSITLGRHVVILLGAALPVAALGCYMLATTGQLTYYFWKLGLGAMVVSTVVTAHAIVVVITDGAGRPRFAVRPLHAAAVMLIAALGIGSVLQQFAAPSLVWSVLTPTSLQARTTSGQAGDVALPLDLAAAMTPQDAARTRLLATRPDDMNAAHASGWFHALSYSSTQRAVSLDDGVFDLALDRQDVNLAVALAKKTLAADDGRVLVTDATLYRAILADVSPGERARVSLVP